MQFVGYLLMGLGVMDVPLALFVVAPRTAPERRPVVMMAMGMAALLQVGAGVALLLL